VAQYRAARLLRIFWHPGRLTAGWLAILAGTAVLIALVWLATSHVIRSEEKAALRHAEVWVDSRAILFAAELDRRLAAVDQTLRIIGDDWRDNPTSFNLSDWRHRAALVPESAAIFRSDAAGRIVQASAERVIGRDISETDAFRDAQGAAGPDRLYIGRAALGPVAQEWQVDLLRPLRDRDGHFAGVIGTMDRIGSLTGDFDISDLGPRSLVGLFGTQDGRVRSTIGPASSPPDTSIADSGLFAAVKAVPAGFWEGRVRPQSIRRIYAFRRIPGQDIALAVGVDREQVLRTAIKPMREAAEFAIGVTLVLLLIAAVLLIELHAMDRREKRLVRDRAALAAANIDQEKARQQGDAKTAQLEAVLFGMADGVLMLDAGLRVVVWNRQFAELAGIPPGLPVVGTPMEELLRAQARAGEFGPVDVEAEVARRMGLLRSGGLIGTMERRRPDGRFVELRRKPLSGGGFVTLITDVTARKQAENAMRQAQAEAEAATTGKARFAAMVSHEIRTPLHALLSSLELLGKIEFFGPRSAILEAARCSGEALFGLMDDILELSRIEARQLTLRISPFGLRSLLESVIEMLQPTAAARGIQLRLSIDDTAPAVLTADPGRLRQVLVNLLSNAAKYANRGEVVLRAERDAVNERNCLRLSVIDPGPAIAADQRDLVFEPFTQLSPGCGLHLGSGLGLAICRNLMALMGGEIGCDSTPSGGNAFWVALPLTSAIDSGDSHRRSDRAPRCRILLVEDIAACRLITTLLLRREGHSVTGAADAEMAVHELECAPYDLLLVDLHLPGVGGVELCGRVRAMSAPNNRVSIIGLTGDSTPETSRAGLAAGMIAVLPKALRPEQWRDLLARCIFWNENSADVTLSEKPPQLFDEERLTELHDKVGAGRFASLTEDCVKDLSALLQQIRHCEATGAGGSERSARHAMTGLAANYGLTSLEYCLKQAAPVQVIAAEVARASEALRSVLVREAV
jgi:signal transduction histidine kinase/CheY-like chemotaxis protein